MKLAIFIVLIMLPCTSYAGRKLKNKPDAVACNGVVWDKADDLTIPPTVAQYKKIYDKYCVHVWGSDDLKDTQKLMKTLIGIVESGAYLNEISWQSNNALFYSDCCR